MGCCGKHNERTAAGLPDVERRILPSDECVLCAEKHLATAYALAVECGYEGVNRPSIIGQLCLAQWHVYHADAKLAELIRDLRHVVQQRREAEADWMSVLAGIDDLANAEATALPRTGH